MPLMQPPVALASCERSLRQLLTHVLNAEFGASWIHQVFDAETVTKLSEKRTEEEKRRTKRGAATVPSNLIEYTEFTQLTRLLNRYWELFKEAMGEKKEISVLLARFGALRNAVAHSRELLPFEEELLSAIAGEIRNRVTIHMSGKDPADNYFPRIELVRDSLGNSSETAMTVQPHMLAVQTATTLRPGDVVTFTCRAVDPQNRTLTWSLQTPEGRRYSNHEGGDVEITWEVRKQDVHTRADALVMLASDGEYHRFGANGFDASVSFRYEVLPPLP
ncbi:hypothetical protein [Streptomyces asiaticus]